MFCAKKTLFCSTLAGIFALSSATCAAAQTAPDVATALARADIKMLKRATGVAKSADTGVAKSADKSAGGEVSAANDGAAKSSDKNFAAKKSAAPAQNLATVLRRARALLNAQKAAQALALLRSECARRCDDKELNFAIIRAALAAKKTDEALAASDRILIADASNFTAHLAAAQIYAEQKNQDLLRLEIAELDARADLSPAQRRSVEQLKKSLKSPFYGVLSFAYGYESNAKHTSAKDFVYHTPLGALQIEGESGEGAGYASVLATIGARAKLGERASNDVSISAFNKYFFKSRDKDFSDLSVFSLADYFDYKLGGGTTLWLGLDYDYAMLKRKPYSHTFSADFSAEKTFANGLNFALGGNISSTSFAQPEDKNDRSLRREAYANFSKNFGRYFVFGRANLGAERAPHSKDISSDYDFFGGQLGAGVKISPRWLLKASLNAQKNRYLRFHPGFLSHRRDEILRANIRAQFALNERTQLALSATYSRQKSNQLLYDYENFASFVNLKFTFN